LSLDEQRKKFTSPSRLPRSAAIGFHDGEATTNDCKYGRKAVSSPVNHYIRTIRDMAGEKVLVVEDNETNMELTATLLEIAGFVVLQAETAEDGIRLAQTEAPALILMDISLPGMDGLTATRVLRGDPSTHLIPVVALTAHAMKGDGDKALAAGCNGYIPKPIDTRVFSKTVAGFLEDPRG
jgi:CheY-like chemotaxis protein